ncbi:MAG: GTPase Era [Chloroflexi bacterium]|nr:GTPase Era [Chloroflexota bacterium]
MSEPEGGVPLDHRAGFVAIIGKPNVGKSTLLNALVGEKIAIISRKPQTTRRQIRGILSRPAAQVIFVDTPGIHKPMHKLGASLVREATAAIPDADVILFVVDVSHPPAPEDDQIADLLRKAQAPKVLAMNKSDLLTPARVLPHSDAYRALGAFDDWMLISATAVRQAHGNLDKLLAMLVERLPFSPPLYPPDQVTDQTERAIVAELVREKALRYLEQEVPHALEVVIEDWQERPNGMLYIEATLLIEKESQKGIVIGAQGAMLKKIGQTARQQIELYIEHPVYLDLRVKVRARWREDEDELRRLGYRP